MSIVFNLTDPFWTNPVLTIGTPSLFRVSFNVTNVPPCRLTPSLNGVPLGLLPPIFVAWEWDAATGIPDSQRFKYIADPLDPTFDLPVNAGAAPLTGYLFIAVEPTNVPPHSLNLQILLSTGASTAPTAATFLVSATPPSDDGTLSLVIDRALATGFPPNISPAGQPPAQGSPLWIASEAAQAVVSLMRDTDWLSMWSLAGTTGPDKSSDYPRPVDGVRAAAHTVAATVTGRTKDTCYTRTFGGFTWNQKNPFTPGAALEVVSVSSACSPSVSQGSTILLSGPTSFVASSVSLDPTAMRRDVIWLGGRPAGLPWTGSNPPLEHTIALSTEPLVDAFFMVKILLQIYSACTGYNVVLDPIGRLGDGPVEVPFHITDAESEVRVLVLTHSPESVHLDVSTGAGEIPDANRGDWKSYKRKGVVETSYMRDGAKKAREQGGCGCSEHEHRDHSRDESKREPAKAGRWRAIVRRVDTAHGHKPGEPRPEIPFAVVVIARSTLKFAAEVETSGPQLGATAYLHATLKEAGLTVGGDRARVWAEVTLPDGNTGTIALHDPIRGSFHAQFPLHQLGITSFRIMASGSLLSGQRFERELTYSVHTQRAAGCVKLCPPPKDVIGSLREQEEDEEPDSGGRVKGAQLLERVLERVAEELRR